MRDDLSMRRFPAIILALAAGIFLLSAPGMIVGGHAVAAEKRARHLFGHKEKPAALQARAIGFYARGCLAGGAMLPVDGPAWQAMRLSRNRNWGHPQLVELVERLAIESKEQEGWPGLLVGDLSQPRGGPMLSGHRSHQVGLDADIWLMPMPDRTLTRKEREKISAVSMIKTSLEINKEHWRPGHVTLLKRAASYKEVERIFVHPAIKKALCEAAGPKAKWLSKVRPYWGHHYHFHIRIKCPPGSTNCKSQKPPPGEPGCGKQLDHWFALLRRPKKPAKPGAKPKKRKEIMITELPKECRAVLAAEDATPAQYASRSQAAAVATASPAQAKPDTAKADDAAQPKQATVPAVPLPGAKPVPDRPARSAAPSSPAVTVPPPSARPDPPALPPTATTPAPAPRPSSQLLPTPLPAPKPLVPPQSVPAARPVASANLPWLRSLVTSGPPLPDRKPK